ncbi:MAG: thioredoxin family protein [Crocinitomicaceae bacterium]|nr:thioredoxin family protein [Crocinitomicaceae bacterium]|tara:strand:+ start:2925 stop:3443 length:519 start_codon:yes stop_codon:yes gene_type:complete
MKYLATLSILLITAFTNTAFIEDYTPQIAEPEWHVKLQEAQAISKKTNKPIFAFFTGSDWCGWCMRLQANVFHKPGFKAWANEHVVLLELDFPRRKQLPAELAQQNNELRAFFRPQGFPTVWIFNMDLNTETNTYEINALGNLGYPRSPQGQEESTFIANANKILQNKGQQN